MEERKLIRLGNSSFALALPKSWVEKSGLKKGDKVFLENNSNGEIVVSSSFKKINGDKLIEINVNKLNPNIIGKEISAAYIKGYDSILFADIKNKELKEVIKNHLKSLISFEIIESNDQKILAKDFFNFEDAKIETFIKRIENNLNEMFSIIIDSLKNNKLSNKNISEIESIEADINKMYNLISRIFFKSIDNPNMINLLKSDTKKLVNEWWISFNLESIGDRLTDLVKFILKCEINKEIFPAIISLIELTKANYESSIHTHFDNNLILEFLNKSKEYQEKVSILKENFKDVDSKILNELKAIETSCYQNVKMGLYLTL